MAMNRYECTFRCVISATDEQDARDEFRKLFREYLVEHVAEHGIEITTYRLVDEELPEEPLPKEPRGRNIDLVNEEDQL